jgi:hypothetical protein
MAADAAGEVVYLSDDEREDPVFIPYSQSSVHDAPNASPKKRTPAVNAVDRPGIVMDPKHKNGSSDL